MTVLAWLRERCPPWLLIPWIGVLAVPGLTRGVEPFAVVGLVALLVLGARLLDDLADRDHDRADEDVEVRARVLVRADDARPFLITWVGLALGSLAVAATLGQGALRGVLVLWLGLSAWYALRPAAWRRLNAALVLLKYPAIVAITLPLPATLGELDPFPLLGAFLCFLAYELLHDERHRAVPVGRALTAVLGAVSAFNPADLPEYLLAAALLTGVATFPFVRARAFAPFPFALPWLIT